MVAHSTPKAGVEWGPPRALVVAQKVGHYYPNSQPRVRLLGMTKGGVALPCGVVVDGCVERLRTIHQRVVWPSLRRGTIR
jgi:hypothetical protein